MIVEGVVLKVDWPLEGGGFLSDASATVVRVAAGRSKPFLLSFADGERLWSRLELLKRLLV